MVLYSFLSVVFSLLECIGFVGFFMVLISASHKIVMLDMRRMRFGIYFPYTLPLRAVNCCWIVRWSCVPKLDTYICNEDFR